MTIIAMLGRGAAGLELAPSLARARQLARFADSSIPASFEGDHWLYLWTTFSLMVLILLTLEWLWRLVASLWEQPAPLFSAFTLQRLIRSGLLLTVLVGAGPDLWVLLRWGDMSPAGRIMASAWDRRLDLATLLPFAVAWALSTVIEPTTNVQLARHAFEPTRSLTWADWRRFATIMGGCLALAAGLAFGR